MTSSYASKTCEELEEALAAAKAAVETPRERADSTINTIIEPGPLAPGEAQPDLFKEIEDIEQAMREAGCAEA